MSTSQMRESTLRAVDKQHHRVRMAALWSLKYEDDSEESEKPVLQEQAEQAEESAE